MRVVRQENRGNQRAQGLHLSGEPLSTVAKRDAYFSGGTSMADGRWKMLPFCSYWIL